jgi:uncharacterized protein (DUF58 family)
MSSDDQRSFLIAGEKAGSRFCFAAPNRVPLGGAGAHLSNRSGSSLEFRDHREYQPGDDLRRIDWSAYGRTDKLITKLYREEVSPHVDIVIDGSRSMNLENSAKLEALLGSAALLASAASNSGYSHCAWLAADACLRIQGGTTRPSLWPTLGFDYDGNPDESFARNRPSWRRQGMRVLLSDLLWLGNPLLTLQNLSRDAAAVFVIQVLAADDAEPQIRGNKRLVDSESGQVREIFIDASALERYKTSLERHQQNWRSSCRQIGAIMVTIIAESLVKHWAVDDLVAAEVLSIS